MCASVHNPQEARCIEFPPETGAIGSSELPSVGSGNCFFARVVHALNY